MHRHTCGFLSQLNAESQEYGNKIAPFTDFISARAKTILQLVGEQNIVDGEIVFRALIESFIKLSYVVLPGDKESVGERLNEFYNVILEIEDFRDSIRSRGMLKQETSVSIRTFLLGSILPKEKEEEVRIKYNFVNDNKSPVYQALDTNWGFGKLVIRFGDNKIYNGPVVHTLVDMRKAWVTASSFSHAGPGAIRFMNQRNARPEMERSNSNLMHVHKLMYSATTYHIWSALILAQFLNRPDVEQSILNTYSPIRQNLIRLKDIIQKEALSAPRYKDA